MPVNLTAGVPSHRLATRAVSIWSSTAEVTDMTWEAPDFVEVKMDAEINSYQDDFGGEQDDRF